MFPYYIIRRMEKEFTKDILSNNKKDKQNFPNRHLYIRLNKRSASLIINSLALTRRYLYYKKTEEIPLEIFFNTNDLEKIFFDLTMYIDKMNEECKNNFNNWEEFKIYK